MIKFMLITVVANDTAVKSNTKMFLEGMHKIAELITVSHIISIQSQYRDDTLELIVTYREDQ